MSNMLKIVMVLVWRSLLRQLTRTLSRQLANTSCFLNVIFGVALFGHTETSLETVDAGRQLFEILERRRKRKTTSRELCAHMNSEKGNCPETALLSSERSNENIDDLVELERVRQLVTTCCQQSLLIDVANEDGYNALQASVMYEDLSFATVLLESGWLLASYGGDTGVTPSASGRCSHPLHVACSRGHIALVDLLLTHGADPSSQSSAPMCYPRRHRPIRHVPSRFHFIETDVYQCDSASVKRGDALWYAIASDQVRIVRHLMVARPDIGVNAAALLRDACRLGAVDCAEYIISSMVDSELSDRRKMSVVNSIDADDDSTPILNAVCSGRRSLVRALVDRGADVRARDRLGRTALHRLFLPNRLPIGVDVTTVTVDRLDCCNFLLACGLESESSATDFSGNTALHLAVDLVNRKSPVGDDHDELFGVDDIGQGEFSTILRMMATLLDHNCDPDILNLSGMSALHQLMTSFVSLTADPIPTRQVNGDASKSRSAPVRSVRLAVETLLFGGATPSLRMNCPEGMTAVEQLLDCVARLEVTWLSTECLNEMIDCLTSLCRSCTPPSDDERTHVAVVSLISRLGRRCVVDLREDFVANEALTSFISGALSILIRYAFDPNRKLSRMPFVLGCRSSSGSLATVNILVEMVRLVADVRFPSLSCDLNRLSRWTLDCLRAGTDPDVEPYPPSITTDDIICHSQSCIFIKPASDVEIRSTCALQQFIDIVADIVNRGRHTMTLTDDEAAIERLFMIFYTSMSHDILFRCLRLATFILLPESSVNVAADDVAVGDQHPPSTSNPRLVARGPRHALARAISKVIFRPRSLKGIARVVIYKALNRRVQSGVPDLPLPIPLKEYLLNFDP